MRQDLVIAVDFDGTLVGYDGEGLAFPMPGAAEAMDRLRANGAYIVVHTCRVTTGRANGTIEAELGFIRACLDDFGIPYDEIYMSDKMIADIYIDDRAVPFEGNWPDVVKRIARRSAG